MSAQGIELSSFLILFSLGIVLLYSYYYLATKNKTLVNALWGNIRYIKHLIPVYVVSILLSVIGFLSALYYLYKTTSLTPYQKQMIPIALILIVFVSMFWMPLSLNYLKINNKTKMTDFSQAIFRFRKLNRGTYLSIILIENDIEDKELKNNDKIYDMLIKNENDFNSKQKDGIEYQLLKTMVRKGTNTEPKNYQEINLEPEFMRNHKFDKESSIVYMRNIIQNLDNNLAQNNFIKNIYDNIISLPENKLITP